jgi:DegT/DnrJ/EryC1/StrS aminotransferase family
VRSSSHGPLIAAVPGRSRIRRDPTGVKTEPLRGLAFGQVLTSDRDPTSPAPIGKQPKTNGTQPAGQPGSHTGKTKAFEDEFAKRHGLTDLVLLDSGSNSFYLAVKLLDLPPGSEVVVPSLTWIACAHAVVLAGCILVFCDVELDTQNVSRRTVEPCLPSRTGAVMVVHYAGKPVDLDNIVDLGIP